MQPRPALSGERLSLLTILTIAVLIQGQVGAAAGVGSCSTTVPGDVDGDGFSPATGDCNEGSALQNPGAVELCDGFDNDCDGFLDDVPFCHPECALYSDSEGLSVTDTLILDFGSYITDRVSVADTRIGALWHVYQGLPVRNLYYSLTIFDRDGGNAVTNGAGASNRVDMVWTGEQYGLVGEMAYSDGTNLPWFQRIAADGTAAVRLDLPQPARIAWTGTEFILAFASTLQRYDRDGNPVGDPVP